MWPWATLTGSPVTLDMSASPAGCPGRGHWVRPQRELCGDAVSTLRSVMFTTRSHRIHTFSDTQMSCCERPAASSLVNTDTQRSAPPCKTASHRAHGKTLEMFSFRARRVLQGCFLCSACYCLYLIGLVFKPSSWWCRSSPDVTCVVQEGGPWSGSVAQTSSTKSGRRWAITQDSLCVCSKLVQEF